MRAAKMKNSDSTGCWQGWEKIDPVLSWWEYKIVQPLGKVVCQLLRKVKDEPYDSTVTVLGIYLKEMKTYPHKDLCASVHRSFIGNLQKQETVQTSFSE